MTGKEQATDNCAVALKRDPRKNNYHFLSKIPDNLLTSIVQLSTLQENDEFECVNATTSEKRILKPSPIPKNDSGMSNNSLELVLDKLIFKLSATKSTEKSVRENDISMEELIKILKLCLLKIKQLSLSLDISKKDSLSKIDRLELERNMLLKDIEMLKRKQYYFTPHENTFTPAPIQHRTGYDYFSQMTPNSTPIKSPSKPKVSSHSEASKKINNSASSIYSSPRSKRSEHHSALFFHYYTSPADSGSDFSSVDNRRNKRRKKEKN